MPTKLKERSKPVEIQRQSYSVNGAKLSSNDPTVVMFDRPQVITNGSPQKDGSFYDIPTLDVDNYNQKVYNTHSSGAIDVLGTVLGLNKDLNAANGGEVTIDGIKFSQAQLEQNGEALLIRDLLLEGLIEFSIGTYGYTDYETGRRTNHRLVELSFVGLGNNDYTDTADNIAAYAAKNGFDTSKYQLSKDSTNMLVKVKNSKDFPIEISYQNAHGEAVKQNLAAGEEIEVERSQVTSIETQLNAAPNPLDKKVAADDAAKAKADKEAADKAAKEKADEDKKNADKKDNAAPTLQDFQKLKDAHEALLKSMNTPLKPEEGTHVDHNNLKTGTRSVETVKNMTPGQRLAKQITLERSGQINSSEYAAINDFNLNEMRKQEKYENYFSDDDTSLGGLIPPYQLMDKITGCSTNYDNFLSQFGFEEMPLNYGWNSRIGDIDFTPLEACAPSPEDDFAVALQLRTQERLSAHSVICNKATRFSATNVINLVAGRYQLAYKRNLARLVVAELQVAVDRRVAGYLTVSADTNGSLIYPSSGQSARLTVVTQVFTDLTDCIEDGVLVMNSQTAAKLIVDLGITTGNAGSLSNGQVSVRNYNALAAALGAPVLVVPRDLMPTLGNTGETRTIPRTADGGGNVTVTHAIFYAATNNWQGATSGGLQFDIDSFGSYEVSVNKTVTGGNVTGPAVVTVTETRSARQRGETVLFGDMWRGGGVLDWREAGGIKA